MTEPKFNNRSNDCITTYSFNSFSTGVKIKQDYWISSAIAIDGLILALLPSGIHILITKRSDKMRDDPNKYCIPCGYLDWDETTHDAMIREVYEETSLYLPDHQKFLIFDNNKQPFLIRDDPKLNRQNVSLIYLSVYDFTMDVDKFPQYVENFNCREVSFVKWISVFDFNNLASMYWAFSHDEIIKQALVYYSRNIQI
jgi:8-oxo-dGTP pyrophosphatase MutT (NUDIX family)